MGKFMFENQGIHSYLVYEIDEEDVMDSLTLGMITNNKIHGIAQALYTQMDNKKYVKYDISTKVPLEQFFVGAVNKKRLLGVFSSIVSALVLAEDYMIDSNSLLLDFSHIFADVTTCEAVLICLPVVNIEQSPVELGNFFKSIMFTTQFDQTENCDYVGQILNYLNGTVKFSLIDFKKLIDELLYISKPQTQQIKKDSIKEESIVQQQPQQSVDIQKKIIQPVKNIALQQMNQTENYEKPTSKQPNSIYQQERKESIGQPVTAISKTTTSTQTQEQEEKEISFFYLMQHYNKENAAAYKAQKEKKKEKKEQTQEKTKKKDKKKKKSDNMAETPRTSFAVPGAPQTDFVVPVQDAGSIEKLRTFVQEQPIVQQSSSSIQEQSSMQVQTQVASMANQSYVSQQQMVERPANFGETTVLGVSAAGGETTVLNVAMMTQQMEIKPYLMRIKNNERIVLNKPVFRIGKEKSYVDYFISDNTAISRSHVNVITREGEYFVVDMNSTNHTYVNGQMIPSNVEVKIVHDTKLRLANEEFEFRCY